MYGNLTAESTEDGDENEEEDDLVGGLFSSKKKGELLDRVKRKYRNPDVSKMMAIILRF